MSLTSFRIAIVFALSFSLSDTVNARILRVGYWGTPVTGIDYAMPDQAVTAATGGTANTTGDTILVYGRDGNQPWSFNNLNKKLVIIGSGYFNYPSSDWTNYNANLQNYQPSSSIAINFKENSDGSQIYGCQLTGSAYVSSTATSINNIKISNCFITSAFYFYGYNHDNWEFSKCYFQGYIYGDYSGLTRFTNLKVFNCIFALNSSSIRLSSAAGQFGIIENCSFIDGNLFLNNHNFIIQNSIFSHNYSLTNYTASSFNNCIFDNTPSPAVNGANNIVAATAANLYIAYPTQGIYSNDERFKLKAGSPAIGAGISNVDCGAFGGVNPYKLSGIPPIPAIYKLTAPGSSANTNPYTITFSVRSNN
jgi:hypothetical protein